MPFATLVASLLLVGDAVCYFSSVLAPSSDAFVTSSVLAPSSDALCY